MSRTRATPSFSVAPELLDRHADDRLVWRQLEPGGEFGDLVDLAAKTQHHDAGEVGMPRVAAEGAA
jgi:hypothetical protein